MVLTGGEREKNVSRVQQVFVKTRNLDPLRWIGLDEAVLAMRQGDGLEVRVAVLDSGIEIRHPKFAGRSLVHDFEVETNTEPAFTDGQGCDAYGHGTAVADLIWREAPRAELGSFRVLGPSLNARTAQVALAARKAISLGYRILNCSFACGIAGHLPIYKEWLDEAFLAGVHVVAASTNHCTPEWPAHFSSVLGVDCSSAGQEFARMPGRMVEFLYPAENLQVAWKDGGERVMTGSSFAAARLSGLLARLLSVYPECDVPTARALLRRIAENGALQT